MCKGTTNFEDVYVVPISVIPKETLEKLNYGWISNHGGIPVDKCIGKEVENLVRLGIITVGTCCGHGKYNAHALALISEKEKVEALGYEMDKYNGYLIFNLISGTSIPDKTNRGVE